jgi:hypothetical protein
LTLSLLPPQIAFRFLISGFYRLPSHPTASRLRTVPGHFTATKALSRVVTLRLSKYFRQLILLIFLITMMLI